MIELLLAKMYVINLKLSKTRLIHGLTFQHRWEPSVHRAPEFCKRHKFHQRRRSSAVVRGESLPLCHLGSYSSGEKGCKPQKPPATPERSLPS